MKHVDIKLTVAGFVQSRGARVPGTRIFCFCFYEMGGRTRPGLEAV